MDFASLAAAIETRTSRRDYIGVSLSSEHMVKLSAFINGLETPFANDDVTLFIHSCAGDASLVKFKGQSHFTAFAAPDTILGKAQAGFVGELFVLFAESLRIGTCWLGLFNRGSVNNAVFGKDDTDLKIPCIVSLGYSQEQFEELESDVQDIERKRKSVEENLHKDSLREFPPAIRKALDCAAKAPSAMNTQSWYFKVGKQQDRFVVEISKPKNFINDKFVFADLNTGIAACHLYVSLMDQNVPCRVELIESGGNPLWKFTLT